MFRRRPSGFMIRDIRPALLRGPPEIWPAKVFALTVGESRLRFRYGFGSPGRTRTNNPEVEPPVLVDSRLPGEDPEPGTYLLTKSLANSLRCIFQGLIRPPASSIGSSCRRSFLQRC